MSDNSAASAIAANVSPFQLHRAPAIIRGPSATRALVRTTGPCFFVKENRMLLLPMEGAYVAERVGCGPEGHLWECHNQPRLQRLSDFKKNGRSRAVPRRLPRLFF